MAKFTMEEQVDYLTLPADSIILVTVESVFVKEIEGRNGRDPWTKLDFKFVIDGIQHVGNGQDPQAYSSLIGTNIYGGTSARFTTSPENKLRQWCEALFGMELGAGFELDTDYLQGRKARAITSVYQKRTMNPTTGRPQEGQQVESLLRLDPNVVNPGTPVATPQKASPVGFAQDGDEPPF